MEEVIKANDAKGDSHFRVSNARGEYGFSEGVTIKINSDEIPMFGPVNNKGYLKAIDYGPFEAMSWEDAEQLATVRVNRALSLLSLRFDSPLIVCSAYVEHRATGKNRTLQTVPHWQVSIPEIIVAYLDATLRQCCSLYREGVNSSSVLYSFLCFYKIAELLQAERKRSLRKMQMEVQDHELPSECLPNDENEAIQWIASLSFVIDKAFTIDFLRWFLPQGVHWGMSFEDVLGQVFRIKRNEVAHAIGTNSILDPDDSELIHSVRLMLPLLRMLVRQMIKTDFPYILEPASGLEKA